MHKKNNCCEVHRSGDNKRKTTRFLVPLFACMMLTSACSLWPEGLKGSSAVPDRTASAATNKPLRMEIEGDFMVRGGIHTVVRVRHDKS